jgi:predicted metal-binding membrane protein
MGARHGLFCVGCCWTLMALLFVAGVMNLLWVAIIAAFVLVEKQFSAGARMSRVAGALLLAWGAWVMLQA